MDYKNTYERFEKQAQEAMSNEDMDQLLKLDREVVELLESLANDAVSSAEEPMYQVFLQKLGALYRSMEAFVTSQKTEASEKLRAITDSKKGIKAYQSNR
jgi:hypothetical protein